ncbi:unnamed protein product [Cuscuta epithymum]|uniref:Uncharacterized protein n=1 Tax=Cuscuta epithymum TaxID=186058 RepID=A0AAV0C486_9ASTE|nr:unnamed protein product [Cuscuta epithymum]
MPKSDASYVSYVENALINEEMRYDTKDLARLLPHLIDQLTDEQKYICIDIVNVVCENTTDTVESEKHLYGSEYCGNIY